MISLIKIQNKFFLTLKQNLKKTELYSPSTDAEPDPHDHVPENFGQLSVSKRQSPKTKVGGGVGHGAEDVLDGVNALKNDHFSEIKLLFWSRL